MNQRMKPLNRRALLLRGVALAAIGLAVPLRGSLAQDASPEASPTEGGGMPPLPAGATVAAQGLWNPGNLAVSADGIVFVAEQGITGGE